MGTVKQNKGFTLIELLIACIFAFVLFSLIAGALNQQYYLDSEGRNYDSERTLSSYYQAIPHTKNRDKFEDCMDEEHEDDPKAIDAEDVRECLADSNSKNFFFD